ncbi:hypothetical protein AAMO2058_001589400 [Amorphochlora amoebiformis]
MISLLMMGGILLVYELVITSYRANMQRAPFWTYMLYMGFAILGLCFMIVSSVLLIALDSTQGKTFRALAIGLVVLVCGIHFQIANTSLQSHIAQWSQERSNRRGSSCPMRSIAQKRTAHVAQSSGGQTTDMLKPQKSQIESESHLSDCRSEQADHEEPVPFRASRRCTFPHFASRTQKIKSRPAMGVSTMKQVAIKGLNQDEKSIPRSGEGMSEIAKPSSSGKPNLPCGESQSLRPKTYIAVVEAPAKRKSTSESMSPAVRQLKISNGRKDPRPSPRDSTTTSTSPPSKLQPTSSIANEKQTSPVSKDPESLASESRKRSPTVIRQFGKDAVFFEMVVRKSVSGADDTYTTGTRACAGGSFSGSVAHKGEHGERKYRSTSARRKRAATVASTRIDTLNRLSILAWILTLTVLPPILFFLVVSFRNIERYSSSVCLERRNYSPLTDFFHFTMLIVNGCYMYSLSSKRRYVRQGNMGSLRPDSRSSAWILNIFPRVGTNRRTVDKSQLDPAPFATRRGPRLGSYQGGSGGLSTPGSYRVASRRSSLTRISNSRLLQKELRAKTLTFRTC